MSNAAAKPLPLFALGISPRAGVLLPRPLKGPYDYKLPKGCNAPRGTLVAAPLGTGGEILGVVWGEAEGNVGDNRLREAVPLEGNPILPAQLCDFIDWVAQYTLNAPGSILAMALRSQAAFEPEGVRVAYIRGAQTPTRMTDARKRVLALADDGLARSVSSFAEEANVTPAVVRGLIAADALIETELPEFPPFARPDPDCARPTLNPSQTEAARVLVSDVGFKRFSVSLLDGVTGSGKTETYFEAVAAAFRHGRQALILLPEISLTVQFLERFAERFGVRPAEWHSDISQRERRRTFRAVMNGEARVVVGARSALFLPFPELGLIVVDEEH